VPAIERGYPQREIAESAYRSQLAIEAGEQVIIGVNQFTVEAETPIRTLYIDEGAQNRQLARLEEVRRRRDAGRVRQALDALEAGAVNGTNTMPLLLEAVRAYATLGEMCDSLRKVWGEYVEDPVI
jgi:methylmalonyl-CoA mutase N-terminal domain/subunit